VVRPLDNDDDDDVKGKKNQDRSRPRSRAFRRDLNPALRIFKVPSTDISINAYRMVTIQPTTTGINPMELIIPGLDDFVDLGRSYFSMELRLKKSDNGNMVAAENCGPSTIWPIPSSSNILTCS